MSVQSMTGFARHEGHVEGLDWVWELRSVNGKGLDIRLRLPQGLEELDAPIRKRISERFKRGNLQVNLQTSQVAETLAPKVNSKLALQLLDAAQELQTHVGGALPSVSELMAIRGVVEFEETSDDTDTRAHRNDDILRGLDTALESLSVMRATEGAAIRDVLVSQVNKLQSLCEQIVQSDARTPEAVRTALQAQVSKLLEASDEFDTQRLHQEAAILAAKADLQEELDRLVVHLSSALKLLGGNGPVGRKLDFLAQEFNRECNTICSKSNSADVTAIGLDMKLLIDQFREQVQNME